MAPDADRRLREFLAATLALWEAEGRVEPVGHPGVASIHAGEGEILLERAPSGDPFRWYLRRLSSDGSELASPRPCGSLVGVLSGLRRMLGIETSATLRIARDP